MYVKPVACKKSRGRRDCAVCLVALWCVWLHILLMLEHIISIRASMIVMYLLLLRDLSTFPPSLLITNYMLRGRSNRLELMCLLRPNDGQTSLTAIYYLRVRSVWPFPVSIATSWLDLGGYRWSLYSACLSANVLGCCTRIHMPIFELSCNFHMHMRIQSTLDWVCTFKYM